VITHLKGFLLVITFGQMVVVMEMWNDKYFLLMTHLSAQAYVSEGLSLDRPINIFLSKKKKPWVEY